MTLRERVVEVGYQSLTKEDQVQLLLCLVLAKKNCKKLASELLSRFGSLASIIDAREVELEAFLSVPQIKVMKSMKHLLSDYLASQITGKTQLDSPTKVAKFARVKLQGQLFEQVLLVFLDNRNALLAHEYLPDGTVDHCIVYPREVVARMLANGAAGLIIVHNHPSGKCEPSRADINLTNKVQTACKAIGARLLDHLVIGYGEHYSFVDNGLL